MTVYHAHNEPPFRLENIPVRIDPRNDRMETPAQPRDKQDNVVSGYNSQPAEMDRRPLTTPAHDERTREDVLIFRSNIRRHECSNGLVYEDAPYHGVRDNDLKSKAPANPKLALEASIGINPETTKRRVSYDPVSGEICVFDNTKDNIYHGHVTAWDKL